MRTFFLLATAAPQAEHKRDSWIRTAYLLIRLATYGMQRKYTYNCAIMLPACSLSINPHTACACVCAVHAEHMPHNAAGTEHARVMSAHTAKWSARLMSLTQIDGYNQFAKSIIAVIILRGTVNGAVRLYRLLCRRFRYFAIDSMLSSIFLFALSVHFCHSFPPHWRLSLCMHFPFAPLCHSI